MSWPKILKIIVLKHSLLLFYAVTMNHFLTRLWYAMKSGLYIATRNDQLSGWTERLQSTSQNQTCTKKCHGHSLVLCCWSDPLQLSESQWNHYIWEVCSANRSDVLKSAMPAAGTDQQNGSNSSPWSPSHRSHNQCFKSWTYWTTKFCLILHIHLTSHWPTTTSSSILTTFAGKTLPQPAGFRKCFPRVHQIKKHGFLCYRNKQTYFSLAKMCWL